MESTEAAAVFSALSQETRLDLLRLLMGEIPNGLPASDIASRLGVPSSTLSFHLAALERAGLTHSTRHGRQIVHAARIAGVRQVAWLPHRNLLRWPSRTLRGLGAAASPFA